MARSVVATTPLAQVRVAPGELVIGGAHYAYEDCTFTIEQLAQRGHFIIVAKPSSRWERLQHWFRRVRG